MDSATTKKNKVNNAIGQEALTAGMNLAQLVGFAAITSVCLFFWIIFSTPFIPILLSWLGINLIWLMWAGKDPTLLFESFLKRRRYHSTENGITTNAAGIPTPEQEPESVLVRSRGKNKRIYSVEKRYKLLTYGEIVLDGHQIGYYLLKNGSELKFIFGWVVEGHSPSLTDLQAGIVLDGLNDGVIALPYNVDLKGYLEVLPGAPSYLDQLKRFLEKAKTKLERAFILHRKKTALEMIDKGMLCEKNVFILAKYKIPLGTSARPSDEKLSKFLERVGPAITAGQVEGNVDVWEQSIQLAYDVCWKSVHHILSSVSLMGMEAKPQTAQQLFTRDWKEIHPSQSAPPVPQLLLYDALGLHEVKFTGPFSYLTPISLLFQDERSMSSVPTFGDETHDLPLHGRYIEEMGAPAGEYVAYLRLGLPSKFPEQEGSVNLGMLRYLNHALIGNYNYRIIWELSKLDAFGEIINQDRKISSAVKRQDEAIERRTINVRAKRELKSSEEARDSLEDGNALCFFSLVIELRRDTVDQLTSDIINLANKLPSTNSKRVEYRIEDYYFQAKSFEYHPLATKPYNRAFRIKSPQAVACMPLIKTKKLDDKGLLLVETASRSPLYLDIVDVVPNSTAIVAYTGGGKTILASELFEDSAVDDAPTLMFDFSSDGGASTYKRIVDNLRICGKNAHYYDVTKYVINIVESEDYSSFSQSELKFRKQSSFDEQSDILSVLVLGANPSATEERDVELTISRIVAAFHYDPDYSDLSPDQVFFSPKILERQRAAKKVGFGNPGYDEMPILRDFVDFAESWFKYQNENGSNSIVDNIDNIILSRLRGVLESSLGASLNGISSFSIDADILVIGLNDTTNKTESLVYATIGLNALMRKARKSRKFSIYVEEGATLFSMGAAFARRIGNLPPTIRKLGGNLVLVTQITSPIFAAGQGEKIFGNIENLILGYSKEITVQEMCSPGLGMRLDIAQKYTQGSYKANPLVGESYWYVKRGDSHVEVAYRPSGLHKVLTFSQPQEIAALERYRIKHSNPEDPTDIKWLLDFERVAQHCWKHRIPPTQICSDVKERR
jgi:Helicase HerA, central domain